MRVTTMLHASPLLFLFALATSAGCGGKVISGAGGNGGNGGGSDAFTACDGPGQCVLVSNSCCGTCGAEELAGKTAVNTAQAEAYFKSVCPEPLPCPACAAEQNPNLFAYCENGACRAADVRTGAASACNTDADCRLRIGTDCCEGCAGDPSQLIAVSTSDDFHALVCGGLTCSDCAWDCPDCAPVYPPDAAAVCNAGHCEVIFAGLGG